MKHNKTMDIGLTMYNMYILITMDVGLTMYNVYILTRKMVPITGRASLFLVFLEFKKI